MKTILFTQNNSLYNLWQSYKLDDVQILTNKSEFFKLLRNTKECIVGIDLSIISEMSATINAIFSENANAKILILSNEPNFNEGKFALALGVKGYANSHMQEIHFKDAIKTIKSDQVWLYPEFIQQMIGQITQNSENLADVGDWQSELSNREKEIAKLIKQGYTNKEIAEISGITLRTVKAHTTAIYNKAGVKDRIGLVLLMQKNG